jgi:hypothetical protein
MGSRHCYPIFKKSCTADMTRYHEYRAFPNTFIIAGSQGPAMHILQRPSSQHSGAFSGK